MGYYAINYSNKVTNSRYYFEPKENISTAVTCIQMMDGSTAYRNGGHFFCFGFKKAVKFDNYEKAFAKLNKLMCKELVKNISIEYIDSD